MKVETNSGFWYALIVSIVSLYIFAAGTAGASEVVEAAVVSHDVITKGTHSKRNNRGFNIRACKPGGSLRVAADSAMNGRTVFCDYKITVLRDDEGNTYTEPYHLGKLGDIIKVKKK